MKSFTITEINEILKGELIGNDNLTINGLEQLKYAKKHHITFIGSSKYARLWNTSVAGAAIVNENLDIEPGDDRAFIKVKNADLAMAKLLEVFSPDPPEFEENFHPSAVIHESVTIGKDCKIGAGCYIGKNVVLGHHHELSQANYQNAFQ